MKKSVLIFDTPTDCENCMLHNADGICQKTKTIAKKNECPLCEIDEVTELKLFILGIT